MINKVYLRPNPRLPKVIALAVLLEHLGKTQDHLPEVIIFTDSMQPKCDDVYNLDCCGNEYRDRGFRTEVEVVIADFGIEPDKALAGLVESVKAHNPQGSRPKHLDKPWGSVGFFTSSGWDVICDVQQGNWKWNDEIVLGPDGEILFDDNGRPKVERKAHREKLGIYDFLWMCVDIVLVHLEARRKQQQAWGDGLKSKVLSSLLEAKFQEKKVSSGNYQFPALSGYIRDLYMTGKKVTEIRDMLRPWFRLWRVVENCLEEAFLVRPTLTVQASGWSCSVFDFYSNGAGEMIRGYDNPFIHKSHLDFDDTATVVIRRATGHVAIMTSRINHDSVARLAGALNRKEPGLWHHERGGIYNGSKSRLEVKISAVPLSEVARLAKQCLVLNHQD